MNILLVADRDDKYGAPHSLLQMAEELNKIDGNNIVILMPRHSTYMEREINRIGCKCYIIKYEACLQGIPSNKWLLPIKWVIRLFPYLIGRILSVRVIGKIIESEKIDIIHANSSREDIGAIIAKIYDLPLVWHIREFGQLDYECYSYRRNMIGYMNDSNAIFVAISEAVRKYWISKGISADRIITIYNGVKEVAYNRTELSKKINMVLMGNICETKGQRNLIECIKYLPEEYLDQINICIIGDGVKHYTDMLKKIVVENEMENIIHFKGYIKDSYKCLNEYSVGVMCSKSEGFGRVTAEYMMAGLAVIASDGGANRELIRDGVDGYIYDSNNKNELLYVIKKMIDNKDNIDLMGKNGRARAIKMFTSEKNAMNIQSLYSKML